MRWMRNGRAVLAVALVACLGVGVLGTYVLGQYVGYNQLSYHVYAPFALLNGGLAQDGAPAGVESFHNPLPYLPWYWMMDSLPPVWTGIITGAVQSLSLWLGLVACWIVSRGARPALRVGLMLCAFVISVCSPLLTENLGSSAIDLVLAGPVLGALVLLMLAGPEARERHFAVGPALCCVVAGLLAGMATGLQPPNIVFAAALAVCAVTGWTSWRQRLLALLNYAVPGMLAALVCAGPWALKLWRMHANPLFPYYNAVFRSPDYPAANFRDVRFVPRSLIEALAYPLRIATGQPETSEYNLRSWSTLSLFVAAALVAVLVLVARPPRRGVDAGPRPGVAARWRLAAFLAVSWVVWLPLFAIIHYMFPFELLIGAGFAALAITRTSLRLPWLLPPAAAVLALATFHPNAPARRPWGTTWYDARGFAELPEGGVYFLGAWPLTYVAPLLPAGARLFAPTRSDNTDGLDMQAGDNTVFARRLHAEIDDRSAPPLLTISRESPSLRLREVLGAYGLGLTGACRMVYTRVDALLACELSRGSQPGLAAAAALPDRFYQLDAADSGAAFVMDITPHGSKLADLAPGVLGTGLAFRLPLAASYLVRIDAGWPVARIRVRAGNEILATADSAGPVTVCLPQAALAANNTASLTFEDATASPPATHRPSAPHMRTLRIELAPPGRCPPT